MRKNSIIRYRVVKYEKTFYGSLFPRPVDNQYLRLPNARQALRMRLSEDFSNYAMYGLEKCIFYKGYIPRHNEYIQP